MLDRAPTFRRSIAMMLVALWMLPLVAAVAHSREHGHRYCQEHQAFEEMTRSAGQSVLGTTGEALLLTSVPAPATATPPALHESCPLLTAGARDEVPSAELAYSFGERLDVSRPATAPPGALSSLPILATAPKASPPARS